MDVTGVLPVGSIQIHVVVADNSVRLSHWRFNSSSVAFL